MTANLNPIFTLTPKIGVALITTANTTRDGTGTMGTVITGGANGTRISRITIQSLGTNTDGVIRLYIGDDAGTPVISLWKEILAPATTGSVTVLEFSSSISLTGESALVLPSGYTLRASTHIAEPYNVIAEGGDY